MGSLSGVRNGEATHICWHCRIKDPVERVVGKARHLQNVLSNLDGNSLHVRVIVTSFGAGMGSETKPIESLRGVHQHQIALSHEIIPLVSPG